MTRTDHSRTISEYRAKMKHILAAAGTDVPAMMPAYRKLALHFDSHSATELSKTDYDAMHLVDELERRLKLWQEFVGGCGERYAECEFANFELSIFEVAKAEEIRSRQQKAIDRLTEYAKSMTRTSPNVILFGAKGTGKDHMATALARIAFLVHGLSVRWSTGPSMCCEFREPLQIKGVTDFDVIRRFTSPNILYISDVVLPGGALSQHQSELLYEIIDQRYRHRKPTWLSANVAGQKQLSESIGAPHVDRLIDGAITIRCDWESHREPQSLRN